MRNKTDKHDWELAAKSLLKSEMIRQEISYAILSERLKGMGIPNVDPNNLRSKINRGSFSAAFLLQALLAIGCDEINIKNLPIRKRVG